MKATRRSFLSSTAVAAGVAAPAFAATSSDQPVTPKPYPPYTIQVPRMKFGKAELGRLLCGTNQFYGYAHFNQVLSSVMKDYYTPERVCDVLHQCNRYGINGFNFVPVPRPKEDLEMFQQQGGKMHLVCQGMDDAPDMVKQLKPLAVYYHGEKIDKAWNEGRFDDVKEWCKKVRDSGTMVGVGTHKPEVIAKVEEENWDVDFYAGCVYNRTRTREEWKAVLGGELVEMQGDCYLVSDPPKMYKVMRASRKPCFAFKIMAAGRINNPEPAFKQAFESIKPIDGVFIGMFPRAKDEVRENAERVQRLLRNKG